MLGRSRFRDRGRGSGVGGANLLNQATIYLGGVAPYHWLDFIANRALYAGADVGNVTGATGYSFTRASTGYYQNADGTLEWFESGQPRMKRDAPNGHNIFLHSEALTTANNWTTPFISNATRTDGALSVTTDEGFVYFARTSSILSGATYTVSADVVCDQTISNVPLRISSSNATSLLVNFVAGVTQRITFAAITGSGDGSVQIGLDARDAIVPGGSNATGYTVTFNKVQLNEGSSATAYVATTTTPVYAARRGDRGVLIEGSRTNLLLRSQEFDNASWTKTGTTVSANAAVAPDGTTTADKWQETAGGSGHVIKQSISVVTGTQYTFSVYAKAGENIYVGLFGLKNSVGKFFNLSTGAVGNNIASAPASASIEALGNGWYRCSITDTETATTSRVFEIYSSKDGTNWDYSGTLDDGIFIWQADLQAGAFPSSPIVTVAAAATRASDSLVYTAGVSYPLSLWAEYNLDSLNAASNQSLVQIDNGSATDRAIMNSSSAGNVFAAQQVTSSSLVASITVGTAHAIGTTYKGAMRVATNNTNGARSGSVGTADTSCALPASPTNIRIGTTSTPADFTFGYIRRIAVFDSALSDGNLTTVST